MKRLHTHSKIFWRRGLPAALFTFLALLLGGCGVSKQVVAEKDELLEDLRSRLAQCDTKSRKLAHDLEACRQLREVTVEETDELRERELELRATLATEIAAKNVEIERLKGRLSVRVLDKILFASGSAAIRGEGKSVLDKVAEAISDTDDLLRVEGHTDDVPIGARLVAKYPSNWELSGARAASVVRYFESGPGIAAERMEAVGHSMYRPVADNDSEDNRQRNRRVELVLTRAPQGS